MSCAWRGIEKQAGWVVGAACFFAQEIGVGKQPDDEQADD